MKRIVTSATIDGRTEYRCGYCAQVSTGYEQASDYGSVPGRHAINLEHVDTRTRIEPCGHTYSGDGDWAHTDQLNPPVVYTWPEMKQLGHRPCDYL